MPQVISRCFMLEFEELATAAIKYRDQQRLTSGDLAVLATLIEREFSKPETEWTTTPLHFFNSFLNQRLLY